jgi:hypothetical protein
MAPQRIAAIARAVPLLLNDARAGNPPRLPAAGETVELRFESAAPDGELLATTADGRTLKLSGLDALGRGLQAGDVLLVKVLTTAPGRLALALSEGGTAPSPAAPAAPPAPFEIEQAAMRIDQVAWLRQVTWQAPDAAALASNWRALVASRVARPALRPTDVGDTAVPAVPAAPTEDGLSRPPQAPAPGDPWLFAVAAWGGMRVMLQLLAVDPDGSKPRRRPGTALALRVELVLAGAGRIVLQLQLVPAGLLLDLGIEHEAAQQPLREMLPALVAAVARAELRVVRCRLLRVPAASFPAGSGSTPGPRLPAAAFDTTLPPAVFRAAAEIVAVLAVPWQLPPAGPFSPLVARA